MICFWNPTLYQVALSEVSSNDKKSGEMIFQFKDPLNLQAPPSAHARAREAERSGGGDGSQAGVAASRRRAAHSTGGPTAPRF